MWAGSMGLSTASAHFTATLNLTACSPGFSRIPKWNLRQDAKSQKPKRFTFRRVGPNPPREAFLRTLRLRVLAGEPRLSFGVRL
jgi:hypothetical protein